MKPVGTKLKPCQQGTEKAIYPLEDSLVMKGSVKSFDAGLGYGFISCAESFKKHGRDVFVHKDQLRNFLVGDSVAFGVRLNSNGHPQAYNLTEAVLTESDSNVVAEKLNGKFAGRVKNINDAKGCGFIECE